ncbi:MAG: hypothetical protein KVP17_003369 [Porospora cf. gigantea B]|uniref:uncharacterized protein n=1 Tax=Porospora cf. gigantea B TaxID=2853592 RepID=UPI0035717BAE|nr:MAG: hypothetical protein KVP17_003369 [Porospora cf. gigantea B]
MIDSHTKWAEAVVVPDKSAETTTSAFFRHWVCRFGVPRLIVSDQGASFTSRLFEGLARRLGVDKLTSSPYHPEGNAPVEAFHPRLSSFLRHVNQEEVPFPEALDAALFSYRATLHGTTQESPFYLTIGLDPSVGLESDWRQRQAPDGTTERLRLLQLTRAEVRNRVQQERERDLARKNLRSRTPLTFEAGQLVLLRTTTLVRKHPKASPKWTMPYRVIKVSQNERSATVRSLISGEKREVHLQDVVFVRPPVCPSQQDEWTEWLRKDPATRSLPPEDFEALAKGFREEMSSTSPTDERKRRAALPSKPIKKKTPRSLV